MAKRKRGKIVANGGDHCETPSIAYADVAPFVTELARHILPPSASDTAKAAAGMTQEQQLREERFQQPSDFERGGTLALQPRLSLPPPRFPLLARPQPRRRRRLLDGGLGGVLLLLPGRG